MSLADSALPVRADHNPITFTFDDRHWRVRGLESQLSCERLKVNLLVSRQDLTHIDTLDLYTSRQRRMFLREAAAELYVDEALLKRDLGRVLLDLEQRQETLIQHTLQQQEPEMPTMTEAERDEALELLKTRSSSSGSWTTTPPVAWWVKPPISWSVTWPESRGCWIGRSRCWCRAVRPRARPRCWKPRWR